MPQIVKHRRTLVLLCSLVVAMFGFCFALVPLYNVFCKVTGLNGKDNGRYRLTENLSADLSRELKIQFIYTIHNDLPWDFYPLTNSIVLHPGELKQIYFFAKNNSSTAIVSRAIPSISPGLAAKHFHKTECFCFDEQLLHAGESKVMPIVFFIDKNLPSNIKEITLSYTIFDTYHPPSTAQLMSMTKGKILSPAKFKES